MVKTCARLCAMTMLLTMIAYAVAAPVTGALEEGPLGLYDGAAFRLTNGRCGDCATLPQALWYFQDEVIAVPKAGLPLSAYSTTERGKGDVRAWAASPVSGTPAYPGLVWMGAPHVVPTATVTADGQHLTTPDGVQMALHIVPKIATNLSYFDASSRAFFSQRPVRLRGTASSDGQGRPRFTARTIWPSDFTIGQGALTLLPLTPSDTLRDFVQAENGGAKSAYSNRLIWQRHPGTPVAGKPVLTIMLNGAQGDDDESLAGHFNIATGNLGPHGEWAGLMANNFYTLDAYGEKGILAGPVPMDNYLADLNSGQGYYRPSTMLVVVLNNARTAAAYQGGVQRIFNHYYRHDLLFDGAQQNCTGLSMDVFTALGWNIPRRGATHPLEALAAYPYKAILDRSLASGRQAYEYLNEEQTRLYPAVAFEAAGQDLLHLLAGRTSRALTLYERQLQSDVEAVILVRIPQLPSSRVFGSAPVFSYDEYMARAPANHADWKIIPVAPRPFPAGLKDGLALTVPARSLLPWPVAAAWGIVLLTLAGLVWWWRRRRQH